MSAVLHLIQSVHGLQDSLPAIADGDQLLFLEDGVWSLATPDMTGLLDRLGARGCGLHALQPDVAARSISVHDAITVVDDAGFVELVVACRHNLNW